MSSSPPFENGSIPFYDQCWASEATAEVFFAWKHRPGDLSTIDNKDWDL
jgi:hypothetical protein